MIKLQAINNVIILKKDKSMVNTTLILPDPQPQSMYDIPEPFTGVIDSVGDVEGWKPGDRIAFNAIGGIYMKIDDREYVVIIPEMIIGKF